MIHANNVSEQLEIIWLTSVDLAAMEQADGALSDLADFTSNLVDINEDTLTIRGTTIIIADRKKFNVWIN